MRIKRENNEKIISFEKGQNVMWRMRRNSRIFKRRPYCYQIDLGIFRISVWYRFVGLFNRMVYNTKKSKTQMELMKHKKILKRLKFFPASMPGDVFSTANILSGSIASILTGS